MSDTLAGRIGDLVTAGRILSAEGVIDSFGHVTARHPDRTDRFLTPSP